MLLKLQAALAALILTAFAGAVHADALPMQNATVRALGMGDAFTAVADDESSLFYNPAGLARVRGINWKIFGIGAGVSDINSFSKIKNLQSGSSGSLANSIDSLYGEHLWAGAGGDSLFTMPMFGFGVYDHGSALVHVNNPVYPNLHTQLVNDFGYVAGMGVPAGLFHFGFDLKYIKRTGGDVTYGPADLADLDTSKIKDTLTKSGLGYGADLGASVVIPAPFFTGAISAVWKNVGKTTYTADSGAYIPADDNDITIGAALNFHPPLVTIRPAVDFTNLNRSDLQLTRKINFGVEIGLPLLDIRGGFHEGYYTAGVGVDLGLFRVDVATYGEELGDYPGQIQDRRYVAEFTMQLGLGNFSADGSGSGKGKNGSSSSSDSSSSDSIWGRHLKQRR